MSNSWFPLQEAENNVHCNDEFFAYFIVLSTQFEREMKQMGEQWRVKLIWVLEFRVYSINDDL